MVAVDLYEKTTAYVLRTFALTHDKIVYDSHRLTIVYLPSIGHLGHTSILPCSTIRNLQNFGQRLHSMCHG